MNNSAKLVLDEGVLRTIALMLAVLVTAVGCGQAEIADSALQLRRARRARHKSASDIVPESDVARSKRVACSSDGQFIELCHFIRPPSAR